MNMKNLLQTLSNIEPAKVEDKNRLIQEGARPGQILNVYMDELDSASLRYLSGVRKTIEECGMAPMSAPMSPPMPKPPASINMTAADANELGSLLKTMANLAGVHEYGKEEPVYRTEPSPVYRDDSSDMRGMVKLIDDGEVEEEIIQDEYDNTPQEQYLDANWPQEGDQNNSLVAAKDELVIRGDEKLTTESLMAEYRAFVAEEKDSSADEKGKINKFEERISKLQERLTNLTKKSTSEYIFDQIAKGETIQDSDFGEFDNKESIRVVVKNLRQLYKKLIYLLVWGELKKIMKKKNRVYQSL
jgi:hypothetical protein